MGSEEIGIEEIGIEETRKALPGSSSLDPAVWFAASAATSELDAWFPVPMPIVTSPTAPIDATRVASQALPKTRARMVGS